MTTGTSRDYSGIDIDPVFTCLKAARGTSTCAVALPPALAGQSTLLPTSSFIEQFSVALETLGANLRSAAMRFAPVAIWWQ